MHSLRFRFRFGEWDLSHRFRLRLTAILSQVAPQILVLARDPGLIGLGLGLGMCYDLLWIFRCQFRFGAIYAVFWALLLRGLR